MRTAANRNAQRVVDPSRCWLRHVRRTRSGETVGATVGRGTFTAQPLDALTGRQGWQAAQIVAVLRDDGQATIKFPNAAGEDGKLHRRRFALLTDGAYRPGEEWIEVMREPGGPNDVLAVVTPVEYDLDRQTLTLTCIDVAGQLLEFRAGDYDLWRGFAPRDVIEHYTRAPIVPYADDFRPLPVGLPASWPGAAATGTLPSGEFYTAAAGSSIAQGPTGGPELISPATSSWLGLGRLDFAGVDPFCWELEARVTMTTTVAQSTAVGGSLLSLNLYAGGAAAVQTQPLATLNVDVNQGLPNGLIDTGQTTLSYYIAGVAYNDVQKRIGIAGRGSHSLRIVSFYRWLFAFVDGELVGFFHRYGGAPATLTGAIMHVYRASATLDALTVKSLAPYALRGADKGDLHLPGTPPPGGLRHRIWSITGIIERWPTAQQRFSRYPFGMTFEEEPVEDRLDATLDLDANTMAPRVSPYGGGLVTGSIYLDLATSDRAVRLASSSNVRLAIGKTIPGQELIDNLTGTATATTPVSTGALRAKLGSKAGWYPFRLEWVGGTGAGGALRLEDTAGDGVTGAAWATVPTSRLSPIGTYDDHVRRDSHREIIGSIADTFGYQWRVDPRTLESGEFPGQIIPRVRVGRDTELVIDDVGATGATVRGTVRDSVDELIADAAGIADPKGSGQLDAAALDLANVGAHAFLTSAYESLSEISELPLLQARIGSLLALRSSANEEVGVRPPGARDLLDTFPLTGALAKLLWRPGDGARLQLDDVDVIDSTPRQFTRIEQDVYPNGVAPPVVSYRQRPRDPAAVLRRALRTSLSAQRNYQGQIVALTGSPVSQALALNAYATDYSRLSLPPSLDDIVAAYVDVAYAGGVARIEVSGVDTGVAMSHPGRYDISQWIRQNQASLDRLLYVRLGPATTAGTFVWQIVLLVRI